MNRTCAIGLRVLLLLCLGTALALYLGRDPNRPIIKRFEELASTVARTPGSGPIESAVKGRALRDLLADPVTFHSRLAGLSGTVSADDVCERFTGIHSMLSSLQAEFGDYQITFPTRTTALVRVTMRLTGSSRTGDSLDDIQEVQCTLRRLDGDWRFAEVEQIEILEK